MNNTTSRKDLVIAAIALMLICAFVIMQWALVRFVHYHSQNTILNPADYEVEVLGADDYKKLADPNAQTVTLSNGKTISRSDTWSQVVFPKYKPANDANQYVLVTTKGTAHFARRYDEIAILVLPLALIALISIAKVSKRTAS